MFDWIESNYSFWATVASNKASKPFGWKASENVIPKNRFLNPHV